LASGTKSESLELHRKVERLAVDLVARGLDRVGQAAQERGVLLGSEARGLEVGGQAHLQDVAGLLGRAERLGIGTAEGDEARVELVPGRGIGVAVGEDRGVDPGNAREVGRRRHVHDREARHARPCRGLQQLAHARQPVLRFLHRQHGEIEAARVHTVGGRGRNAPRHRARPDLDQALASLYRHAHDDALGIDELRGGRAADEHDVVPGEGHPGTHQGAIGGAENQDLAWHLASLRKPVDPMTPREDPCPELVLRQAGLRGMRTFARPAEAA
jgi:hypothetical protein